MTEILQMHQLTYSISVILHNSPTSLKSPSPDTIRIAQHSIFKQPAKCLEREETTINILAKGGGEE